MKNINSLNNETKNSVRGQTAKAIGTDVLERNFQKR